MTFTTNHKLLKHCHALFPELSKVQNSTSYRSFRKKLLNYAKHDSILVLAMDHETVCGMMLLIPATYNSYITNVCTSINLNFRYSLIRSQIYVRKEYRGQGISIKLHEESLRSAALLGYEYLTDFAHENQEIYEWSKSVSGATESKMEDSNGNNIIWYKAKEDV